MVPNPATKRKRMTLLEKLDILQFYEAQSAENKYQAAKRTMSHFELPNTTFYYILKRRDRIAAACAEDMDAMQEDEPNKMSRGGDARFMKLGMSIRKHLPSPRPKRVGVGRFSPDYLAAVRALFEERADLGDPITKIGVMKAAAEVAPDFGLAAPPSHGTIHQYLRTIWKDVSYTTRKTSRQESPPAKKAPVKKRLARNSRRGGTAAAGASTTAAAAVDEIQRRRIQLPKKPPSRDVNIETEAKKRIAKGDLVFAVFLRSLEGPTLSGVDFDSLVQLYDFWLQFDSEGMRAKDLLASKMMKESTSEAITLWNDAFCQWARNYLASSKKSSLRTRAVCAAIGLQ